MKCLSLALLALVLGATRVAGQTSPAPAADTAGVPSDSMRLYYLREVEVAPQLRNAEQIRRHIARAYPDSLRSRGTTAIVVLRFVVDVHGHVTPGSVEVVSSTDPAFEAPARETAAQMLFSAAAVRGRPVRVEVTLPLQFASRQ